MQLAHGEEKRRFLRPLWRKKKEGWGCSGTVLIGHLKRKRNRREGESFSSGGGGERGMTQKIVRPREEK